MLSIEKKAEYSCMVRDLIYEFLTKQNYAIITPLILGFVINFDMDHYPRVEETLKECYR